MGTNRKIKTDGNLEIESSQVDINSDIDVTGDVGTTTLTTSGNATVGGDVDATGDLGGATATVTGNATIGGTLGVTGQATLSGLAYPASDGTADQALVTNGSGVLSFADVASGGGVDTVTSASEASSYSGTNRIIYITATEAVVFTTDLRDRLIIMKEEQDLTFRNANIRNCIIQHYDDVIFDITTTDGTDYQVIGNTIQCFGGIKFVDNSNTLGNIFTISNNTFKCVTFEFSNMNTLGYSLQNTSVHCFLFKTSGTHTGEHVHVYQASIVRAENVEGVIKVGSGGKVECLEGSGTNNIKLTDKDDNVLINSVYNFPFKANQNGVDTKVIVKAYPNVASQSITTTDATKITLAGTHIDNTSSFDAATNYRFTAKVKGEYLVMPKVFLDSVNTDVVFEARTNGVSSNTDNIYSAYVDSASRVVNGAMIIDLDANDYLEFYSDSASDASYTINNALTVVSIKKIN